MQHKFESCQFFHMNSIVLNAASSSENKNKKNSLQPGYSSPSSGDLNGELVEEASLEVVDLIKIDIQGHTINSFIVLVDGWTNIKK